MNERKGGADALRKKVRIALIGILAAVFLGSGVMLARQAMQYQEGEETYSEAETLVGLPDFSASSTPADSPSESGTVYVDPYADALAAMDFTALREVNSDVLGWILIPGTKISYPMVQTTDNQYYLTHTWKKWSSVVGAIFLEKSCEGDFSGFNTIIYGHRMNNGSMFAGLKYYKQKSYFQGHPAVYITDDNGTRRYDIFAAYEVSTQGDTYRFGQQSDQSKQSYIDYCLSKSLYDTGVTPTVNDKIVTLSTCTGNGHATRWVVQARLQGAEVEKTAESLEPDVSAEPETAPVEQPPVDSGLAGVENGELVQSDSSAQPDSESQTDRMEQSDASIPADGSAQSAAQTDGPQTTN